jgi:ribosomal protein S18 acetylase RimI-like enzyme
MIRAAVPEDAEPIATVLIAVELTDGQGNEEKCPDIHYVRSACDETTYRQAVVEDAQCISVLASQVFMDTYAARGVNRDLAIEVTSTLSIESFLKRLELKTVELFVAEHAGYMVGLIDLDLESTCPDPTVTGMEVLRLYVQRPFHRRGIGCALMRLAEERTRRASHQAIWLTAWAGNLAARDFYRSLGYRDVGSTPYFIEGKAYENRILVKQVAAGVA